MLFRSPNHEASFDPQKIVNLLSLSPAQLDNMGIVKRDLTMIGIPGSIAEKMIDSNFDANIVNTYLQSVGLLGQTYSLYSDLDCKCSNMVRGITVDGKANQIFSSSVSTTSSSISDYVKKSKGIGRYLFGYTTTSTKAQNINSTYFLYGEHDHDAGLLHEGIDLRYTANDHEAFRAILDGKVMAINMGASGFGTLVLKPTDQNVHIMFLHANEYLSTIKVGDSVSGGNFIGYQGGRKGLSADYFVHHVHVEARDTSRLGPASDTNLTLESYAPYDYLWPAVKTNFR